MGQVRCGESPCSSQRSTLTERFESFVASLEVCFGITLARPQLDSLGDIKKFCSGLLEGQSDHPWRVSLRGLSASSRMSIAHSLFLFRKLVPSEKPLVGPYVERMCSPSDPPDPRFLQFAVRTIQRMFPLGWDRSYQDKVTTSTLPITACSERGRSQGGCRGLDVQARWDRADFAQYVSESVAPRVRGVSRVQAILTEGKWRIISIPPLVDNALRPLHSCLYDYVSRFKWCLRGDAKPSRFKGFSMSDGEVFVSGDYESATDNLNSEVQRTILNTILGQSLTIPLGIRDHALSSYSSLLEGGGVSGEQQRGQLMGQLTSFPLLCLVNYITFKFFVRRSVPLRINGDDIVFRSTPEEYDVWRRGVNVSGLTLSAGKTLVHRRFFSLNSTMFRAGSTSPSFVPFIRPKAIYSDKEWECERIASLKSRFYSFSVGFGKERASVFRKLFLRSNLQTIYRSRRSLTRGLGIKVRKDELIDSGLWHRELFYLENEVERPLPSGSFSSYRTNDTPKGWSKVSRYRVPLEQARGWAYRFSFETVRNAWINPVRADSCAREAWMADCDAGCSPWGMASYVNPRIRAMLGLSRKAMWKYMFLRVNESFFGRVRFEIGKGCDKPDAVADDNSVDNLPPVVGDFRAVPPPLCLS